MGRHAGGRSLQMKGANEQPCHQPVAPVGDDGDNTGPLSSANPVARIQAEPDIGRLYMYPPVPPVFLSVCAYIVTRGLDDIVYDSVPSALAGSPGGGTTRA